MKSSTKAQLKQTRLAPSAPTLELFGLAAPKDTARSTLHKTLPIRQHWVKHQISQQPNLQSMHLRGRRTRPSPLKRFASIVCSSGEENYDENVPDRQVVTQ